MTSFKSQVHALFPTPVGSYSGFSGQDVLQEKLLGLLTADQARINTQDPQLRHWFDASGGGVLDIEEPVLQDLKNWILECALSFVQQVQCLKCDGLQVINSWCNSADIGAIQAPHSHENSWISGTYYVRFEKGHAPIALALKTRTTESSYLSIATCEQRSSFSADEIQIAPAPGTLLLWPSHLLHGHSGNARNGRLSLSMNLLPHRLAGSSYGLELSAFK